MAAIEIDVEDYLDEVSTKVLLAELARRQIAPSAALTLDDIDSVIALLDLGRWQEARDDLKILRRGGAPMTAHERAKLAIKYDIARKAAAL